MITSEYGCNCYFKNKKKCYPSPILHVIISTKDIEENITLPISRTTTSENIKQVIDEMNVHKQVQDVASKIVDLKKKKRRIDASVNKLEKELEKLFDSEGVDALEIDMGILYRKQIDKGYEWYIEI